MRKTLILLFLGCLCLTAVAQATRPRPHFRPDWVFQAPRPGNGTYLYVVEHGEGRTKREAINQALGRVFQSTANRIGQAISTEEINKAVQAGTDFEVIARNMKVPINKVCEFPVQDTLTNSWTMYVLCQVAKAGNITPEFEATDECTKHERFDTALKRWKEEQEKIEADRIAQEQAALKAHKKEQASDNTKAFFASMFIPGMGQMMKGSKYGEKKYVGEGVGILLSELVLLGAGTGSYLYAQKQNDLLKGWGVDYETYNNAQKMKKIFTYTSYGCFGAAVVIWGVNLYRACAIKKKDYAFYPTVIPTTNYDYALGVGGTIKF